jgi:hypothetical protein
MVSPRSTVATVIGLESDAVSIFLGVAKPQADLLFFDGVLGSWGCFFALG